MKRILVIDNYDSFTYNLVHILRELGLGNEVDIFRNDQFELDRVSEYEHILLSPGPGVPKNAGLMPKVIETFAPEKNILGVCLGHQGIAEAFGARLFNLPVVFHGVTTRVKLQKEDPLFYGVPSEFQVCRYHSWVVESETLPDSLEVLCVEEEHGKIMGIRHKEFDVRGVQFHPESIMTEHGKKLIDNWIQIRK